VISRTRKLTQVTAPAFLLGAVAAFISVLLSRMNRIIDRSQALNAISDNDQTKSRLKSDIPRLKRRAALLNRAIFFSTISAIMTSLLVIVAFASAYFNVRHEYDVALLFIIALVFFTAARPSAQFCATGGRADCLRQWRGLSKGRRPTISCARSDILYGARAPPRARTLHCVYSTS